MIAQACDPMLASLFTPPRPGIGHYDVCTRSDSLETVMAEGRTAGIQFGEVDAVEPLDGFGSAGAYNRFALVKLYGGMRVRVTRGWRQVGDRFESVTLLSPHPDASLEHTDRLKVRGRRRRDRDLRAQARVTAVVDLPC